MRLIILAAGQGARLSPATDNIPKTLLDIGGGVTVLDRQLEAARSSGIDQVRVVTGFQSEQIESKLRDRSDLGLDLDILYNPFYRTTNNLVSIWMARSAMDDDFILINGDNVFRPSVLAGLVNDSGPIQATISRKSRYDGDDSKVLIENEVISRISKDLPEESTSAEWVGICAVRGEGLSGFVGVLDRVIRLQAFRDEPHYLPFYQELIDSGQSMRFREVPSDSWAEIDYQMDLDFVRTNLTRFEDH